MGGQGGWVIEEPGGGKRSGEGIWIVQVRESSWAAIGDGAEDVDARLEQNWPCLAALTVLECGGVVGLVGREGSMIPA